MNTKIFLLALAAVLPTPAALAQTQATDAERLRSMSAREFRRLTVPGATVAKNVERLTSEMRWHRTLGAALAEGRAKGKPVVWIQALGDLEGFL